MILIDAPGGPEIQAALKNEHVQKVVDILLQIREADKDFFDDIADFLQRCDGEMPSKKFAKKLRVLISEYGFESIDTIGQPVLSSLPFADELFLALKALYDAGKDIINYRRGAIVELLTYKLVNSRCRDGECRSNHRFSNPSNRYKSDQVDVVVLSEREFQIEGYSCKINIYSIKHHELTDIYYLSKNQKS